MALRLIRKCIMVTGDDLLYYYDLEERKVAMVSGQ